MSWRGLLGVFVLCLWGLVPTASQAQQRPLAAVLVDHLCANKLGGNEEDRLFGIISTTVRSTIGYAGGLYSPDLIDDAIQDSLDRLIAACPQLNGMEDSRTLGTVVDVVSKRTSELIRDPQTAYTGETLNKASAADLSEELSSPEIDAWLEALTPRNRALALFLYASDVTTPEIAQAVGTTPAIAAGGMADSKTSLLKFFREAPDAVPAAPSSPPQSGSAMEFTFANPSFLSLLQPGSTVPTRITGISSEIYGGWSLLALVQGLRADQTPDVPQPFLLQPETAGRKRMLVTGIEEISDPNTAVRRFLLKAFAIDATPDGSGLHDTLRLGDPAVANPDATATLENNQLSAIEKTRCLWRDFATGPDPGLCR